MLTIYSTAFFKALAALCRQHEKITCHLGDTTSIAVRIFLGKRVTTINLGMGKCKTMQVCLSGPY